MPTLLLTGFGPFPGAPFNPTMKLVAQLTRLRRPALADINIVSHIFETSYAAVDRELPALIEKHKPDALLMLGLATRAQHLRIETRARNALALLPDASGKALRRGAIASGAPAAMQMPAPTRRLLAAARMARVPVALSRDAGRYLCNYLCWRAAEATLRPGGPRLAAFVHLPLVRRNPRPATYSVHSRASGNPGRYGKAWRSGPLGPRFRGDERKIAARDLFHAGGDLLVALVAAVNRP